MAEWIYRLGRLGQMLDLEIVRPHLRYLPTVKLSDCTVCQYIWYFRFELSLMINWSQVNEPFGCHMLVGSCAWCKPGIGGLPFSCLDCLMVPVQVTKDWFSVAYRTVLLAYSLINKSQIPPLETPGGLASSDAENAEFLNDFFQSLFRVDDGNDQKPVNEKLPIPFPINQFRSRLSAGWNESKIQFNWNSKLLVEMSMKKNIQNYINYQVSLNIHTVLMVNINMKNKILC